MPDERNRDTELILPPGVFAHILDETKGHINTLSGPNKISLSQTDRLVVFNTETKRFDSAPSQKAAIQSFVVAPKGHYMILENPSVNLKQPKPQSSEILTLETLRYGQIENIPGPASFPLWPGQVARVVRGHHLRSNQYLLVRVYDDEAARANWGNTVIKSVTPETTQPGDLPRVRTQFPAEHQVLTGDQKSESEFKPNEPSVTTLPAQSILGINKDSLVTGQQLLIKGTEVAFYIPPTGIEVLEDDTEDELALDDAEQDHYVRNAVTLERLEYSILLDENGNKQYLKGPDVVFPLPTQQFVTSRTDGNKRKFRAFELQESSGIHVKVIADYQDEVTNQTHKAGDELFITGKTQAIYFPRPEHAIITYGNQEKYNAIAIPDGEGRYVLNRNNGEITLVRGPKMFLPDPREEVVVRRILSDNECRLYYPGNEEVLNVNRQLRTESGMDFSFGNTSAPTAGAGYASLDYDQSGLEGALRSRAVMAAAPAMERSTKGMIADAMNRGTRYTPPRTITLANGKYEGAVHIEPFSGYAVQVVNSNGDRRIIVGPQTILLEYDEKLERLTLSKGKPKNSDNRVDTVYLKHISNSVSDILSLKTQDLVNVELTLKYLVRFEESDKDKWFSVDNYVQYMVDHLRSLIGNQVRSIGVQDFYQNATKILRDIVLGEKNSAIEERPLHHFEENGMTVYDLELITITVKDDQVQNLLATSRQETLKDSIELERQKQKLNLVQGTEQAKRQIADERALTEQQEHELEVNRLNWQAEQKGMSLDTDLNLQQQRKRAEQEIGKIDIATKALYQDQREKDNELTQQIAEAELIRKVKLLTEEATSSKTKMESIQPALVEALIAAANVGILEKVTPQLAALAFVNNQDLEKTLETMLKGTGAEKILGNLKNMRTRTTTLTE